VAARFVGTTVDLADDQSLNLGRDAAGHLSFTLVLKA
jgi:hypothetical protein